jgi:hypothetical protein
MTYFQMYVWGEESGGGRDDVGRARWMDVEGED